MHKTQKSDSQVFQEKWTEMHQKEWLFPQNFNFKHGNQEIEGPSNSEDYLSYFARKQKLFLFRCPRAYSLPLLEANKDKIVFSAHMTEGAVVVPYTVIQLDGEKSHLILDWSWDPKLEEFMFPATLFVRNQLDYPKFLVENAKFQHEDNSEKPFGFGQR